MEACIFAGQGTQFQGMGKELFHKYPSYLDICDETLGYSIKKLCLENFDNKLNQTEYTQPAVYVVNALSYLEYLNNNKKPSMVAGHSLGEFNALLAANVFDFATGLKLVKKRGQLMGKIKDGGMAAVLGIGSKEVSNVIKKYQLSKIYISNYNSPLQTIISGDLEELKLAKNIFKSIGCKRYIVLNVNAAFHTVYMSSAKEKFGSEVNRIHLKSPTIPVISNINAQPYHHCTIKETIINHMIYPVQWNKTIIYMLRHNIEKINSVGYGKMLQNLYYQIKKEFEQRNVNNFKELE